MATNDSATARKSEPTPPTEGAKPRATLTPVMNNMGPRGIPLPAIVKPAEGDKPAIVEKTASMLMLPIRLSFVKTSEWERAKTLDNVKMAMKERVRGTKAEEWREMKIGEKILVEREPVDAKQPLAHLGEPEAIDYITDIVDVPTLRMLEAKDKREKVVMAIRERADLIEKNGVKGADEVEERDTAIGIE